MSGGPPNRQAIEDAWKIHSAVIDWTKGVDNKASFVLTIETAVLGGVIALMGENRRLAHLHGVWENGLLATGISLLALAVLLVALLVRPRTRPKNTESEASSNFVYFGHLNYRRAEDVERALLDEDILPVLCRQVVIMSKIAWKKHLQLKWSMTASIAGTMLVALTAAIR